MSQIPKGVERRWIILAPDGRHVTMGRAAPPSEAEVEAAAAALAAQGLAGKTAVSGQDADLAAIKRVKAGTQTVTEPEAPFQVVVDPNELLPLEKRARVLLWQEGSSE